MKKIWIIIVTFVLLLATMPWFFTVPRMTQIFGFPPWALYSLIMVIVFAVVVAVFLGKYWTDLAEDDDDENI